ncbi:MAG: hypothetical protein ACLQFR_16625 [Streptosporangiaceae bacterium]
MRVLLRPRWLAWHAVVKVTADEAPCGPGARRDHALTAFGQIVGERYHPWRVG